MIFAKLIPLYNKYRHIAWSLDDVLAGNPGNHLNMNQQ